MTVQERIAAEIHSFIVDRRHLDYIESDRNADLITEWLGSEGLAISAESLHAAYVALHDKLDVYPRYAPVPAPVPQPAIPVSPPQTESAELHAVERRSGESSWMAARRAFAEQQISAQRKARQQMRAEVQSAPPRKTNREINNQFAAVRKPRGRGAAFIIENGEKECFSTHTPRQIPD